MSIPLAVKYAKNADEMFAAESKISLLTNRDYDFNGAHTVLIYKMSTVPMNNYARNVGLNDNADAHLSRFGRLVDLGASTEELLLKRDRSFIFNVDILDQEESGDVIEAAAALARELREVVIPEVDAYTYGVMVEKAGTKASVQALTRDNIYTAILAGSEALDSAGYRACVGADARRIYPAQAVHRVRQYGSRCRPADERRGRDPGWHECGAGSSVQIAGRIRLPDRTSQRDGGTGEAGRLQCPY